jgi:hypothetical protein
VFPFLSCVCVSERSYVHGVKLPVRSMFSCLEDLAYQVEVLVFFVLIDTCWNRSGLEHLRCDLSGRLGVQKRGGHRFEIAFS